MSSVRDARTRLLTATAAVAIAALSLTACDDGSGEHGAGSSASTGDSGASAGEAVACEGSSTKTVAAPVNKPVNHMLLTVTNTGGAPCHLYGYPAARFGEARSVPSVIQDSKPQAVITLAPRASGYAAANLSATDSSGEDARIVKSLTIAFQGRTGRDASSVARPPLPATGVYVDDSLSVTYWQQSMDDALSW